MKKEKIYIGIVSFLVLLMIIINLPKPEVQTVVAECLEKDDCWKPVKEKYCGIEYDCVAGKCYSEDLICPEMCSSDEDEDMDGLYGCDDPDCWDSEYCHCLRASYNRCIYGECYCPSGTKSSWIVSGSGSSCECK